MFTKQEKLAAARKKLKEFQGKQRCNDYNRTKSHSTEPGKETSSCDSLNERTDIVNNDQNRFECTSDVSNQERIEEKIVDSIRRGYDSINNLNTNQSKLSAMKLTEGVSNSSTSVLLPVDTILDTKQQEFSAVSCEEFTSPVCSDMFSNFESELTYINTESPSVKENECTNLTSECNVLLKSCEENYAQKGVNNNKADLRNGTTHKDNPHYCISNTVYCSTACNDLSDSMKCQLPVKSASPIMQLQEENNNLSQILKRTEDFLKYKTVEVENMAQKILFLTSKVGELEADISNSEKIIQNLTLVNDQLKNENNGYKKALEEMGKKLDSNVEQLSELQQKWELKKNECQVLNVKLQETQSQLSSSLIKIQQLSVGDVPGFSNKISILQNENSCLIQKVQDLERSIEILKSEKEQSSQHFHSYVQHCKNQLQSLSSEVKTLSSENTLLAEKNGNLEKNLKLLETQKNELQAAENNSEICNLSSKINELKKMNESLLTQSQQKSEEIQALQKENFQKGEDLKLMENIVQDLRSENLKLSEELDSDNSNLKLLAAMESDKIAASRAMSQNQKLKDQITELEEAFIKLSHEKLQLTDELEHEKHMKKNLELKLKDHELHKIDDIESCGPTINESANVEELRNIIRQLEHDKTELILRSRLTDPLRTSPATFEDNIEKGCSQVSENRITCDSNITPENSKFILQMMEEKVKKTMNEIAVLNEEKEKLEHLVLQLQGETETIGEYISLYQTQRMLMRKRNKEKDDQLLQLSKDKEELKSKLMTLNDLVHHLLSEKVIDYKEPLVSGSSGVIHASSNTETPVSEDTATKIQKLISEIQSTNLINNESVAFEHCPCCSGRLITV